MIEAPLDFSPVLLMEVDIARDIPDVTLVQPSSGRRYARAQSLVRAHTHPLGYVTLSGDLTEAIRAFKELYVKDNPGVVTGAQ